MYQARETHRLMFNPLTLEYRIIEIQSSQLNFRGSTWQEIVSGTLTECEAEMKVLS